MDIRPTSDGELVILHEPSVDRTTNGRGPDEQKTQKETKNLDAGMIRKNWKHYITAGSTFLWSTICTR